MSGFSRGVTMAAIALGVRLIFTVIDKEREKKEGIEDISKNPKAKHCVIRVPKTISALCFFSGLFFLFFTCLSFKQLSGVDDIWPSVGLSIFSLIFFCIDVYSMLWKIEIFRDKDYFIFRRFIKQHKIYYRDCESYKFNSPYNRSFNEDSITIKTNTKKIRVEAILINSEAISLMLKKYNVPKVRDDLQSCIVVKMRKIHTAIITIATLCSFGVFVLCCFSDSSDIFVILFFAAFVLFSVIATLYYLLFRVEIIKGKDYFVYRAPFVKKTKNILQVLPAI